MVTGDFMFTIRDYNKNDAEKILSWITDEKSFRQWSADKYKTYPATADDMNSFYDGISKEGAKQFVFCEDGKAIGHFVLRPDPDGDAHSARLGFIVVDSSIRGKGYGKTMLLKALELVFDTLGKRRVTLGVFENNPKALKCYQSIGFTQWSESVCVINDEAWKCLEMECLKRE